MSESRIVEGSLLYTLFTQLRESASNSLLIAGLRGGAAATAAAFHRSGVGSIRRTAAEWVRHSQLFRWFTTDPDSDIVAIDLRTTWTIGPILRAIDDPGERLQTYWARSVLKDVLTNSGRILERSARNSVVVDSLSTALKPPEPREPDGTEHDDQ